MLKLVTLLTSAAIVAGAAPAEAQIYTWRDANGSLVLSDRPLSPDAETYPVATATRVSPSLPAGSSAPLRVARRAVSRRSLDYDDLIEQHAASHGVRADLVRAVIQVESAFDPRARSPKGAMGLMQLMPATAAEMGVRDPYDPADNIRGGVAYLRQLLNRYGDDEELALAAYNAGPTAVDEYGRTVPPYRETQRYVSLVKDLTEVSDGSRRVIYKTVEIVNGRPVARYTDTKPKTGDYEVVTRLR